MKLSEVRHPILVYATFGMGGSTDPELRTVVERMVIVDHGKEVALFYAPGRRPWKDLAKSALMTFAGTVAVNQARANAASEAERQAISAEMSKTIGAVVGDDLAKAIGRWHREGYYTLNGQRYYKGAIEVEPFALEWPRLSLPRLSQPQNSPRGQ